MNFLHLVKISLPVVLGFTFFAGCSIQDNTAEMWTNQPELAAYAEEFNTHQPTYRVKVVYRENPGADLLKASVVPDLVLAHGLNSLRFATILLDLSELLDPERGTLAKEEFYRDLLVLGQNSEQQLTLPVSFSLPALYHAEASVSEEDYLTLLDSDGLLKMNRSFNKNGGENFPVMGYSPRWNGHYLCSQAILQGANFREGPEGNLHWAKEALEDVKTAVVKWVEDSNGGFEAERRFAEKYLYQPGFKLVRSGRVLFQFTTIDEFYTLPTQERQHLRLLWISDGKRVPVYSDILFAGIPRRGEDREAAKAFLSWFFQKDTQAGLLESSQFKRIRGFGIAQGFSSLILVNELNLPQFYPHLIGNVPSEANLLFPRVLPVEWEAIRRDVIVPWLLEETSEGGAEIPLEKSLEDWYHQNPILRH